MSRPEENKVHREYPKHPDINEMAFRIVQAATAEKPVEEARPDDMTTDRVSSIIRPFADTQTSGNRQEPQARRPAAG